MIGHDFTHWQAERPAARLFATCSPNLRAIAVGLERFMSWGNLGCYGSRPIRGAAAPSTHSWGAAIDLSYHALDRRTMVETEVLPWLVAWSSELHLQAIHDYVGSRIWRAGRTAAESEACTLWWRAQRPDAHGMGKEWAHWIHLETTRGGWHDARPLAERGIT